MVVVCFVGQSPDMGCYLLCVFWYSLVFIVPAIKQRLQFVFPRTSWISGKLELSVMTLRLLFQKLSIPCSSCYCFVYHLASWCSSADMCTMEVVCLGSQTSLCQRCCRQGHKKHPPKSPLKVNRTSLLSLHLSLLTLQKASIKPSQGAALSTQNNASENEKTTIVDRSLVWCVLWTLRKLKTLDKSVEPLHPCHQPGIADVFTQGLTRTKLLRETISEAWVPNILTMEQIYYTCCIPYSCNANYNKHDIKSRPFLSFRRSAAVILPAALHLCTLRCTQGRSEVASGHVDPKIRSTVVIRNPQKSVSDVVRVSSPIFDTNIKNNIESRAVTFEEGLFEPSEPSVKTC